MSKNPIENLISDGGYTAIFRTIGVIGDSLASGEHEGFDGETTSYNDYYEYSWGQFMARKCGNTVINFSRGGMTAKEFNTFGNDMQCFTHEKICQAYIIALGRNDLRFWDGYANGFGCLDDVDFENPENNKDSFVGHYVKIIQKIRSVQPKCRIFLVTMPVMAADSEETVAKIDTHAEFLRNLADTFEFTYLIDLRKYAPVHDEQFVSTYYCGGHFNAMGYLLAANQISTYIDYIIRNNPKDFTQVAFLGKNVHNINEKW